MLRPQRTLDGIVVRRFCANPLRKPQQELDPSASLYYRQGLEFPSYCVIFAELWRIFRDFVVRSSILSQDRLILPLGNP